MELVRARLKERVPEISTYFQTGGLIDSVVNQGLPAPIDLQVSGTNMKNAYSVATEIRQRLSGAQDVGDMLIPQDIDYPGLQLNVNREMAGRLGLSSSEVVDNVITSLSSNGMIAPSYWVDPKNGNNYLLTVQFLQSQIGSMTDFEQIPVRAPGQKQVTTLSSVSQIQPIKTPTEVDHPRERTWPRLSRTSIASFIRQQFQMDCALRCEAVWRG
jgi:multidrug efflux pump subunit AcrB